MNGWIKESIGERWKDEWKEVKVKGERMNKMKYKWKVNGWMKGGKGKRWKDE